MNSLLKACHLHGLRVVMRQVLTILLLGLFGFSLASPLVFASDADSKAACLLPAKRSASLRDGGNAPTVGSGRRSHAVPIVPGCTSSPGANWGWLTQSLRRQLCVRFQRGDASKSHRSTPSNPR